MKRNAYLIKKYVQTYMLASIMSSSILKINSIINSYLMGNYIGPEALAAIGVATPIIDILNAMATLLSGGAVILIGKAFGERDSEKANQIAIVAIISAIAVGLLISLASIFFVNSVSFWLCLGNSLFPLVSSYLQIVLFGSVIVILFVVLEGLVAVAGHPEVVVKIGFVCCVIQVSLNIILVGNLGLGLNGAAISLLLSMLFSITMYIWFINRKKLYNYIIHGIDIFKVLSKNIKQGMPLMVSWCSYIATVMLINYFIQKSYGEQGMFVIAIFLIVLDIGDVFARAANSTFSSVGSMLIGRGDHLGAKMLSVINILIVTLTTVAIIAFVYMFPTQIASFFGGNLLYADIMEYALPLAVIYIIADTVLYASTIIYQICGRIILCLICIFIRPLLLMIGFVSVITIGWNEGIWYVFPAVGLISIPLVILCSEIVRKNKRGELYPIYLLPKPLKDGKRMNFSIPCDQTGLNDAVIGLRDFCEIVNTDEDLTNKVMHCLEELLINVVEHSGCKENSFVDVGIVIKPKELKAYLQDGGKPFDPTKQDIGEKTIGLKILNEYCNDIEYQYLYGQNFTVLKWEK